VPDEVLPSSFKNWMTEMLSKKSCSILFQSEESSKGALWGEESDLSSRFSFRGSRDQRDAPRRHEIFSPVVAGRLQVKMDILLKVGEEFVVLIEKEGRWEKRDGVCCGGSGRGEYISDSLFLSHELL
jgi:hypothetical protein